MTVGCCIICLGELAVYNAVAMLAFGGTCNVSGHLSVDMHAEKATGPDTQQLYKSTVNIS